MNRLYIAEKPAQAADIAKALGIKARKDGYIELVNGDAFTWAFGHLIELENPEGQDARWGGRWRLDNLPIAPRTWVYTERAKVKAQLRVIRGLLKTAKSVVIATDSGREGELIARELLEYFKWKGPIQRFWTSALTDADIRKALGSLLPGEEKRYLYEQALARQHADFVYGLSATRGASVVLNVRGQTFNTGRVQTAVLAMLVRREEAIRTFKARDYFEIEATVTTSGGRSFTMTHAPADDKRMYDKAEALRRMELAKAFRGPLQVKHESGRLAPPLAYSLPVLQQDANRALGFSAKKTLGLAQELYERKLLTYPRTDMPFLAESLKAEVPAVLKSLCGPYPREAKAVLATGPRFRSEVFNDKKLKDHHGIIPTNVYEPLQGEHAQLYALVAQRFLQLLSEDEEHQDVRATLNANGVEFKASGRKVVKEGWKGIKLLAAQADS